MSKLRRVLLILAVPAILILVIAIATPQVIKHRVNQRLAAMENHQGSIASATVHWFKAEIELNNLTIRRKNSGYEQPLFSAPSVDIQLHRVAPVSSSLTFNSPTLFAAIEQDAEGQLGLGEDWLDIIRDLVPLPIRQGEVRDGVLTATFNLPEERMQTTITNIDAVMEREQEKSAADSVKFKLSASLQSGGSASDITLSSTSLAEKPASRSDVQLSIATTPLPPLNPLLRYYGDIDVNSGQYKLDLTARVRDSQVNGTLKTKITNLDVLSFGRDKPSSWLFEGIVGGLAALVGKGPDNKIDLEIPISGQLDDTQLATRAGLAGQLKNLLPSITDWSL